MRKRPRIVFGLLVTAALGSLLWLLTRKPAEPAYAGKPLKFWLRQYDSTTYVGGAPPERREALQKEASHALQHMGTNAMPTLLSMLRAKDNPLVSKIRGTRWIYRFIRPQDLPAPAETLNREATWGFQVMGADAQFAVPELVKIYERSNSFWSMEATAEALGYLGPAAKGALPSLLRNASNADVQVRRDAVLAICRINAEPSLVIPTMIENLHDPDFSVRWNAALVLGDFGSRAKPAFSALMAARKDESIREQVDIALKRIDPEMAAEAGVK